MPATFLRTVSGPRRIVSMSDHELAQMLQATVDQPEAVAFMVEEARWRGFVDRDGVLEPPTAPSSTACTDDRQGRST
jgi:hypothetical protein